MENGYDPEFRSAKPPSKPKLPRTSHYYGDMVRKIFLICGFIMIATLPFFKSKISASVFYSLLLILVLVFFAGMINPKLKKVVIGDIVISIIGFSAFGVEAINKFSRIFDLFFATNLALSILFLFAFYFSIKTFRGMHFPEVVLKQEPLPKADIEFEKPSVSAPKLSEEESRKKRFMSDESL